MTTSGCVVVFSDFISPQKTTNHCWVNDTEQRYRTMRKLGIITMETKFLGFF